MFPAGALERFLHHGSLCAVKYRDLTAAAAAAAAPMSILLPPVEATTMPRSSCFILGVFSCDTPQQGLQQMEHTPLFTISEANGALP